VGDDAGDKTEEGGVWEGWGCWSNHYDCGEKKILGKIINSLLQSLYNGLNEDVGGC